MIFIIFFIGLIGFCLWGALRSQNKPSLRNDIRNIHNMLERREMLEILERNRLDTQDHLNKLFDEKAKETDSLFDELKDELDKEIDELEKPSLS